MMMEEINDDTNGESSFEFVGGKGEENCPKEHVSSSTVSITAQQEPVTPVTNYFVPTQSSNGLFSPAVPSQPSFVSSSSAPQTPIPMFDPSKQPMPSPMQFPSTYNSPVPAPAQTTSPYIPLGKGYFSSPTAPLSTYSSSQPMQSQSALELPIDDGYVSSSNQVCNEKNERGMWGWIKGNDFLNRVAEKAKSSVDSVITTLDPGMKEIIYSGGDLNIVVASGNEAKISAVREAFQQVFGKATVEGASSQATCIAPQPVGFSAGTKAVEERILNLRQQNIFSESQVVVAVENFLAEFTPDKWFDLGCLFLQDPSNGINLQVYTQATPVDSYFVAQAKEQTPPDYPLGWSGYAVTVGQVMGPALGVHHSHWHEALTGTSRKDMLILAAKSLAGMYKTQWRRPV